MKRIIYTLIALVSFIGAKADMKDADYDFTASLGPKDNPTLMYFKWVDKEAKTCKTAVDPDIELYIKENPFVLDDITSDTGGGGTYKPISCGGKEMKLRYISNPDAYVNIQAPEVANWNGGFVFPEDGKFKFINEEGEEDEATIVEISDYAFANGKITCAIKIPRTVKKIGKAAFYRYSDWGGGTLDLSNVEEIGEYAFADGNMGNIIFPENECYVKEGAFANLGGVSSLELNYPNLHLGDYAFYKCTSLKSLEITALGNNLKDDEGKTIPQGESIFENAENLANGIIDNIDIPKRMFLNCGQYKNIVIGDHIERIGEAAFYRCNVETVKLGENLKYIGTAAFMPCTGIDGPLTIPDSVIEIGDYAFYHCTQACPLTFSKNLEWIGDFAFFYNKYECQSSWTLHSKLKHVGINAFQFNRTSGTEGAWKDLYVYAYAKTKEECPEMDWAENPDYETNPNNPSKGFSGFGEYNPDLEETQGWYNRYEYWCYAYVCLHVPQGCYEAYSTHPEWGKFHCIIADLVPEDSFTDDEDGSIQKHVGYVFLSLEPNVSSDDYKSYPLTEDLFGDENFKNRTSQLVDEWEIYVPEDNDINDGNESQLKNITTLISPLDEDYPGDDAENKTWFVKPNKYGQQLILGYNNTDSFEWDYGQNKWVPKRSLVGAIMVFVCPTVTLVYDNTPNPQKLGVRALSSTSTEGDESQVSSNYDEVVNSSSSYQHRAIYNSYPKFGLTAPLGITIETIEKAHYNEDGIYTDDYTGREEVEDDQLVGEGSDTSNDGGYIVPLNAITENRVIKLSSSLDDDMREVPTTIGTVELSDKISVTTNGLSLTVNGAEENAIIRIYDPQGVMLKKTTDKTVTLPYAGVYIVTVEDIAFKAFVH